MKKISILATAAICAATLMGCGASEEYSDYQMEKVDQALSYAPQMIRAIETVPNGQLDTYLALYYGQQAAPWDELTMEEVASYAESYYGIEADGYGFYNAITSFTSAYEDMGAISAIDEENMTYEIEDESIIVTVPVTYENGEATAEVIFSNDVFLTLESASVTQNFTMAEKMEKAGLNTLIGIGTVFTVLVLICLIIYLFGFIPKIQNAIAQSKKDKEAAKNSNENGIDNAVNQIIANETTASDESDDTELVAVIAAAIAAYEGSGSTDGYVVRSIRRRR